MEVAEPASSSRGFTAGDDTAGGAARTTSTDPRRASVRTVRGGARPAGRRRSARWRRRPAAGPARGRPPTARPAGRRRPSAARRPAPSPPAAAPCPRGTRTDRGPGRRAWPLAPPGVGKRARASWALLSAAMVPPRSRGQGVGGRQGASCRGAQGPRASAHDAGGAASRVTSVRPGHFGLAGPAPGLQVSTALMLARSLSASLALLLVSTSARAQPALAGTPPPPASEPASRVPFGDFDSSWQNGQSRQKDFPLKPLSDIVTVSLYLDVYYGFSLNRPRDNTLTGTASVGRHNELQIGLASVGFDWNYRNVIGRLSLQYGNMLSIVQDTDGSVSRGRGLSYENLRYIREATLGYHVDAAYGVNVEAGIFMSYIGLESYLLAENWNYNRSLVCEFTPFYFQGLRVQVFPSKNVKIEPWVMNGFQAYGKWNSAPSAGFATRWAPSEAVALTLNTYVGTDTKNDGDRVRFHSDHSVLVRYRNAPDARGVSKAAFSLNNHLGFESGGQGPGAGDAHMLGSSLAHRLWFDRDRFSLSVRGEVVNNQSRYMVQYPPPGFASGHGEPLTIYGVTGTLEVDPTDFFLVRFEVMHRRSDVPFFAGRGGTTSADGYQDGTTDGFVPGLSRRQTLLTLSANFRL
ncbi:MAG: porin [Myxococcales bacterium]|nr:MAG: porin [Myxococcales bacterium]